MTISSSSGFGKGWGEYGGRPSPGLLVSSSEAMPMRCLNCCHCMRQLTTIPPSVVEWIHPAAPGFWRESGYEGNRIQRVGGVVGQHQKTVIARFRHGGNNARRPGNRNVQRLLHHSALRILVAHMHPASTIGGV